MEDEKEPPSSSAEFDRRGFVKLSVAAGLGVAAPAIIRKDVTIVESDVAVKTPDGTCDAVFFHPAKGKHPGVLVWPDSGSLRPVFPTARTLSIKLTLSALGVNSSPCIRRACDLIL